MPNITSPRRPCDLPNPESTSSFWHREPDPVLVGHRTTRDLPETADVAIIGSGMTGTSTAYSLLNGNDKPLKVVMLEAREACWGATGRNGGHCQPLLFTHPDEPEIGHFELANFHTLHALIREKNIDCEFNVQPGVQAIYSDYHLARVTEALKTVQEKSPELAERMKLVTDPKELAALRVHSAIGAVVTNIAARMWPYKFVAHVLSELLTTPLPPGQSFNLQTLTPVTAVSPSHSQGVHIATARGTLLAKKVILATNGYTSHLLPAFADLIVPCRGQMSALRPPPSLATEDNRLKTSVGLLGDGVDDYLIQRPTERGGELMFGGARHEGKQTMGVTDDSVVDEWSSKYLRQKLVDFLAIPKGEVGKEGLEASHIWTGIMGYSRDDKPWVGRVPGDGNALFMAAGFTGHGMPNTWLCGKAVARMVMEDDGKDEEGLRSLVEREVGLPKSYWASQERVERIKPPCRGSSIGLEPEPQGRGFEPHLRLFLYSPTRWVETTSKTFLFGFSL
ncbi:unnamed protein product [Zymoseptoria tritici ST99CH_1A5]|uniref:FAD dependent oxidoreductase domain-containing protein n=1 Tax=Zymoseptoria tritici ST99CH_1A5 TaxID=1276529 RepID=A0A1Y6LI40_ZYMTR|nr:unnamed protein product [Zymoseptoria tritici ST99CH_1A5]